MKGILASRYTLGDRDHICLGFFFKREDLEENPRLEGTHVVTCRERSYD